MNLARSRSSARWHDLVGFTGVAIVETDDPNALSSWLMQWNAICDIETTPGTR